MFELLAGRYYLEEKVSGAATNAELYFAVDTYTDDAVVVKFVERPLVSGYRMLDEQFKRDCDVAACLRQSYIATLVDVGESAGRAFLVYARPKGKSLRMIQQSRHGLSPQAVIDVVLQTSSALDFAHSYGLAHGSVDADHIMVGTDGVARMLGFGSACAKAIAADRIAQPAASTDVANLIALARRLLATHPHALSAFERRPGVPNPRTAAELGQSLGSVSVGAYKHAGALNMKLRTIAAAMFGVGVIAVGAMLASSQTTAALPLASRSR